MCKHEKDCDFAQGMFNDDICPKTGKKHAPDFGTVTLEDDGGDVYVDVSCRDCGRSGCLGKASQLVDDICW